MRKGTIGMLSLLAGFVGGVSVIARTSETELKKEAQRIEDVWKYANQLADKHLQLFLLMNQWVGIKQKGKNLTSYFERNGYKRIAIYGMSYVGITLVEELKGTNIEIVYGIDQKADDVNTAFDIFTMEDPLDVVDVVIVTAVTFYDDILKKLSKKICCPIVSLETVLREV